MSTSARHNINRRIKTARPPSLADGHIRNKSLDDDARVRLSEQPVHHKLWVKQNSNHT